MTTTAVATRNGNGHGEIAAAASYGLVPSSMGEAMKLAEMMASAKLVPKDLQKSPADCLMVIQQAVRWQMDPFAVAQECSVIQGKLMHSGKLVAAVVNTRGNLAERLSFAYAGTGNTRMITVSGRLQGEGASRTVSVLLKDAQTNANVWKTQPDQQLMYHGTRVWARRHTPELMLGVYSPEEFNEAAEPRAEAIEAPRQNPHVTRAADVAELTEAEASHIPDIPQGTPPTTRLLIKDQRPLFDAKLKEMHATKTIPELKAWGAANADEVAKFKDDWQQMFRDKYKAHMISLPVGDGLDIPPALDRREPPPGDPEKFLKWADGVLAGVTDPGMLDPTWDYRIEPHLQQLLPPDQEEVLGIYRKHEARLAP